MGLNYIKTVQSLIDYEQPSDRTRPVKYQINSGLEKSYNGPQTAFCSTSPCINSQGGQIKGEWTVEITKDTRVSDILTEYGDIADVMEVFGVKRVSGYSVRRMLTKALTVEWAARVHRVPLDEFLDKLRRAVETKSENG
jgi:hypothetical protein